LYLLSAPSSLPPSLSLSSGDTLVAADYKNEAEVGEALREAFQTGLVKREELFITTKVSTVNLQVFITTKL